LSVVAKSGSPAVTKGISAVSPRSLSALSFCSRRLMRYLPLKVPGSRPVLNEVKDLTDPSNLRMREAAHIEL
jgi:hypothetical protein